MSNTNDNTNQISPSMPVTPMDMVLVQASAWLDNIEKKLDEAKQQQQPPMQDDIPTFVTRQS